MNNNTITMEDLYDIAIREMERYGSTMFVRENAEVNIRAKQVLNGELELSGFRNIMEEMAMAAMDIVSMNDLKYFEDKNDFIDAYHRKVIERLA